MSSPIAKGPNRGASIAFRFPAAVQTVCRHRRSAITVRGRILFEPAIVDRPYGAIA